MNNNIIEFYGRQAIEKAVYDALVHYVSDRWELQKARDHVHEIADNTIEEFSIKLLKSSIKIKNVNWDNET